jgi:phosphohistidine swiveling domain-containing protein
VKTWITDTATTERFPLFTRGNADEVGPEPFPPLTWTLAWEKGAAPGTADAWVHLGGFRQEEFRQPVPEVFGCWGGYFYNQVSVGRVFGVRTPGGTPDDIDRAYFGGNPDVPPYVPNPADEDEELSAALGLTIAAILSSQEVPYLDAFSARARAWAAERPDLTAMGDAELVAHGRMTNLRLRETWDVYAQVVVAASIGPGAVHAIASAVGRGDDAVAVFTSLGGVETAGTSHRVWELSRLVRRSPALTQAFEAGLDGLPERLSALTTEDGVAFQAELASLLAEHGHRGPNEWDLMSDTWLTEPRLALAVIDRVRLQSDENSPSDRSPMGAVLREKVTAELLDLVAGDPEASATLSAGIRSGQLYYRKREAGKDAAVRVMLEAKLPFFELGRRMAERGLVENPKHVFQLLESELDAFVAEPGGWAEVLSQRAAQFATLSEREPPYTVSHDVPVPPIDEWPLRSRGHGEQAGAGTELSGIGVSPGQVTGRARVVYDLSEADDLEPGDILVCATTDPSWVPLFMVAGGVVCEIGAQASHAAIVSRELGVPCVSSVDRARARIPHGALITLDGSSGTVAVLEG